MDQFPYADCFDELNILITCAPTVGGRYVRNKTDIGKKFGRGEL
jgi:hypothetical protein